MMTLSTALANMTSYTLTGGAAIAPDMATDTDYICLASINTVVCDWPNKNKYPDEPQTLCLSFEGTDLIITTSESLYDRWVLSTDVCKRLPTISKRERKIVFKAICLGRIDDLQLPSHRSPWPGEVS